MGTLIEHKGGLKPAVGSVLLDSFNPEAMAETLQRSTLEHTQLSRGRFRGRLFQAQSNACRLDYGEYNLPVLARGPLAPDRISLGFLLQSPAECSFNGESARQGDLLVYGEGMELHARLAPGCRWVSLQVRRDALAEAGLALPQSLYAAYGLDKVTSSGLERDLLAGLQLLGLEGIDQGQQPDPALVMSGVEDAVISAFCRAQGARQRHQTMPSSTAAHSGNPMSIIQRAEAYMEAHLAEPITISRICAQTACPVHTLERVFLKSHGVTPKQFLTYRRLTALRSLLIKHSPEDMSVTSAALSCGLTHLGRAAVRYRQLFGETPSATLKAWSRV